MDKQKEIEKIEFIIGSTIRECEQKDCIRNCEFARRKDCKYCRAAKDLVNSGYGDTQAAVKAFASKVKELIHGFENISQSTDDCLCEKIDELIEEEYGDEV